MTLHVVALDAELFKSKYQSMSNSVEESNEDSQEQVADLLLNSCIEECQITSFSGELNLPDGAMFDDWAEAIPDFGTVKKCMLFLKQLQSQSNESTPWFIAKSSQKVKLSLPEELNQYSKDVHACKFYEILLSNLVTGQSAYSFIELSEFLELSSTNSCCIFSWVS
ncbi:MAG: hypothetical protein K2X81_10125 [Candidatus Obscuribacterales bacterium]|nr:hypothetical protein [Candidatus Obscuribacterales bacterium]